jgi:glycine/D-amino acid oxidase-like deaminating enzyme
MALRLSRSVGVSQSQVLARNQAGTWLEHFWPVFLCLCLLVMKEETVMNTGTQFQPHLHNAHADLVIVGGGAAGIYLTEAIQPYIGGSFRTILLEQKELLGGSYEASLQQFRTFQGVEALSQTIARTVSWYEALSQELFAGTHSLISFFPYLFLAKDAAQIAGLIATLKLTQEWGFGANAELVTCEEIRRRYPFIDGEIAGGLIYPHAGRLDFDHAMVEIIKRASKNTLFARGTRLLQVIVERGKVVGVKTSRGDVIQTERVVMATGPFFLKILDQLQDNPLGGRRVNDFFYVQLRESFGAEIRGLSVQVTVFIIAPDDVYVRISTGSDGNGEGIYGYASPYDPLITDPELYPRANDFEFPAEVYYRLSEVMSMYEDEPRSPSAPMNRRRPLFCKAGYYATTKDELPIVSSTTVQGLYILSGLEGIGIMAGKGCADSMAEIMFKGEPANNPYSLSRDFTLKKSGVVL